MEEQAHGASSKEVGELSAWQSGVGGEDNAQLILCDNAETHQLAAPHPPEVTMRRKSRRRATTFFKMPNSTSVFSERSCASSMMTAEYLKRSQTVHMLVTTEAPGVEEALVGSVHDAGRVPARQEHARLRCSTAGTLCSKCPA